MKRVLLLIALTILPAAAQAGFGRFHALVIGSQNYKHLSKLKTPLADAEAVAEVLEEQYGFTVELLLDKTRADILLALAKLRRTMTSEEGNLLIYYAGHGYLDEPTGTGYWQPVDAQTDNTVYWIPTDEITRLLKAIQARHVLVVADSCYSGSLLMRDSGARLPTGMERDEWLRRMQERRSSGGEEPVADGGGSGHSVFAKAFLEVLRENKAILDGDSLFDKIKRPVILNAPQTPFYGDIKMTGHEMGDFLFRPKELQEGGIKEKPESKADLDFLKRGDGTAKKMHKQGDTMTDPSTGMEFFYVPGGCFMMGSPKTEKYHRDDEGLHEVCVDGFWMGKYKVTQGQWKNVMGSNPSGFPKGDDYPVEQVFYDDAKTFIDRLNSKTGKAYRLSTEAEWEYVCRANGECNRWMVMMRLEYERCIAAGATNCSQPESCIAVETNCSQPESWNINFGFRLVLPVR